MKGKHEDRKRPRRHNNKKIVLKIVLFIFIAIFAYSTYEVVYWMRSNNELKELEIGIFKEVVTVEENNEGTETKKIDFEKLEAINPDVVGWIYIENTGINYPIMQTTNNEYYLKKDINKKQSSCGSIYLDCNTKSDFSESNSIIYGHTLKSGGMFSELNNICNGDLGNNIVIEIYTKEASYKYQVIAAYITEIDLSITKKNLTEKQKEAYLTKAMNKSKIQFENSSNVDGEILTLITCHGKQRAIINATKIK